jgi:hypothetical protein
MYLKVVATAWIAKTGDHNAVMSLQLRITPRFLRPGTPALTQQNRLPKRLLGYSRELELGTLSPPAGADRQTFSDLTSVLNSSCLFARP